jgi:hypothetical protein
MALYAHYKDSTDGDYYTVTTINNPSLSDPSEEGYVGHFIIKDGGIYQCGNYAGDPNFNLERFIEQAALTPAQDFEI